MDPFNISSYESKKGIGGNGKSVPGQRAEWIANENRQRLYFAVFLAAIILTIGFIAYHYIEGWDWVTSLYFMSSTMTTVGYGDVTPKTTAGKLMTVFFMWVGISIGFYLLYSFSKVREIEIDNRVRKFLGDKGAGRPGN